MQIRRAIWGLLLKVGLMASATAAVALAFWNPLNREARSHAAHITRTLARGVQTDIMDEVRYQMLAQLRLASLFGLGPKLSERDWESQARLFMVHHPGYVAIERLDASYRKLSVVPAGADAEYEAASDTAAQRQALAVLENRCGEGAVLTPAFRLRNGKIGRRFAVPICGDQEFLGLQVAVVDETRLLAEILADDTGLGHGIAILDGEEEIFRTAGSSYEDDQRWGHDAEVTLPGATWYVRVWPESVMLRAIESGLPKQALLMGALIGLLLSTTIDFARTSYFRSKELRRAHDDLEIRVEERTAELQLANQELKGQVHERKRAEASLQELSARLLQLRDEEQRRIARELHDSTVQTMGALAIDLERIQKLLPVGNNSGIQKLLTDSCELVERATVELRTISFLLHPPMLDELGLEGVLPWYAAGFSSRSGINTDVEVQANLGRLPHELELALFRIVQEALTNIHRHSGSPTARITVFRDAARVTLQIVDRGKGISPGTLAPQDGARGAIGVGIAGMRERVRQLDGELHIESGDQGTSLKVVFPVTESGPLSESDGEVRVTFDAASNNSEAKKSR